MYLFLASGLSARNLSNSANAILLASCSTSSIIF